MDNFPIDKMKGDAQGSGEMIRETYGQKHMMKSRNVCK